MDAESDDPKPERFCEYDDLIEVRVTSNDLSTFEPPG